MHDHAEPLTADAVRADAAHRRPTDDFDAFVVARGAALVRLARGILRDPAHAEDVVQDVLVKVYLHWERIQRLDVPEAYVQRMVLNACTSFWRRAARRETAYSGEDVTALGDRRRTAPDGSSAVDDRDLVVSLLRRLPPKQRAALVLRHYEGLQDAEVAALLGCTPQTVRSNVHRGLATLRGLLDAAGADDPDVSAAGPPAAGGTRRAAGHPARRPPGCPRS